MNTITSVKTIISVLICGAALSFGLANTWGAEPFSTLLFSKTLLFRHASITNGIAAIKDLGAGNRFNVDATEDSRVFTPDNLSKYRVVILLSTSGEIFNDMQKTALKNF